jgi:uracil-DNA glycosylase
MITKIAKLHARIRKCRRCFPHGGNKPVPGEGGGRTRGVMFIGQAPGVREPIEQRMFAWTAGKRLFQWLATIGLEESRVRTRAYIAAVTKCYPGKAKGGGGDRKPAPWEVANCAPYLDEAMRLLKPRVVVPIGGLALERILGVKELTGCIGREFKARLPHGEAVVIPLPHPSGASTWFVRKENKERLRRALALLTRRSKGLV